MGPAGRRSVCAVNDGGATGPGGRPSAGTRLQGCPQDGAGKVLPGQGRFGESGNGA